MRAVMAGYTLKKLIYMKPSAVSLWVDVCVWESGRGSDAAACLVRSDATWTDLSPCGWQDADWREGSAGWGGLWLEHTGTAGWGVLGTAVRNVKQSGVPTRYKRAAWSRGLGVGGWLKAFLQRPPVCVCAHIRTIPRFWQTDSPEPAKLDVLLQNRDQCEERWSGGC